MIFLIFIVLQRIDSESVKTWEQHFGSTKEIPTWNQFSEFFISRLLSLKAYEKSRTGKIDSQPYQNIIKSHYHGKSNESTYVNTKTCPICKEHHYILVCPSYSNKSVQQRIAIIKKHKLCYNCLGHHLVSQCNSTKRCIKCAAKHHSSIHQTSLVNKSAKPVTSKFEFINTLNSKESQVLHSSIK